MSVKNKIIPAITFALIIMFNGMLMAQATIGGSIYSGANDGSGPVLAPNPMTPAITNASVMVQNQHNSGAFITYGTVSGNSWTASVPAPGDYVVMFSAPGHDVTSREFIVEPGDNLSKDAYLPPLFKNPDGAPSPNELPLANLLVYVFLDNYVNGEDDFPDDPGLKGVTITVKDEHGNVLATGVSGTQTAAQIPVGAGPDINGLYYFTGLPPGEVIVSSDPSTVPLYDPNYAPGTEWYLMTSEEGGHTWDPKLYPGDSGTEDGSYLIWHSYVQKMGQINSANVTDRFGAGFDLSNAGSISGILVDADKANLDADEPWPIPGQNHPGASFNNRVPDGFVVLFTNMENLSVRPVATVEADPVTGEFSFQNVPPGTYKMFISDLPIDYVWVQQELNVQPNENLIFAENTILIPRLFARAQGYVRDVAGNPISGANVHIRFKDGSIKKTEITDANGWYNFDDLSEIEVLGHVDVEPPAGYRGQMRTETIYPENGVDRTFNATHRCIQWFTANYRADLYVEPIPVSVGQISGFVWNDNLERSASWSGDGVYDPEEERTQHGVTVELWDNLGTTMIASTTTGKVDEADLFVQGWIQPYTATPDEAGGVFVSQLPGFYEFRDVSPGSYQVKIHPNDALSDPALVGFSPSPAGSKTAAAAAVAGSATEVIFGVNTQAPLSGEIEGGVFDDFFVDNRPGSLLRFEKAGIDYAPVGFYDHLGYQLGWGKMGNPLCYAGSVLCPGGEEPVQKPEMERRLAPGVHLFLGNDPSLPGYNPNYIPITLAYKFSQGQYKFEADWSLIPAAFGGLGNVLNMNQQVIPDNAPLITNGNGRSAVILREGANFRIYGQNFGDGRGWGTVTLSGFKVDIVNWTNQYIDIKIPNGVNAISGPLVVANSTGISNALPIEINYSSKMRRYFEQRSVFVDANYHGPENGSKNHPYNTISEAVRNAPSYTPRIINVKPGVYREHVKLQDEHTYLIGSGAYETTIDATPDLGFNGANAAFPAGSVDFGPAISIGQYNSGSGDEVENIRINGFTIRGGTDGEVGGGGIFSDLGNRKITINTCIIRDNGGEYGGGISVNDEPEYDPEHSEPEHIVDDYNPGPPPGTYLIYNNLIYHNLSMDYGGGICMYEIKDRLKIYGNIIMENMSEDHGGGLFFEDCGPVELYSNIILRNFNYDDGGGISFEDVADTLSRVDIYNNVIAYNISDDHGENRARGAGIAFDDTRNARVTNNTIVGNIVAGSFYPAGGGIDAERHGHEYNGAGGPYMAPGFSDPIIVNNIIRDNWRLTYDQPGGEEDDAPYFTGTNFQWEVDNLHVDNPQINGLWETHVNSESFSNVHYNDLSSSYLNGINNYDADPAFVAEADNNFKLSAGSPAINKSPKIYAPDQDIQNRGRRAHRGFVDTGAFEWERTDLAIMRMPTGILGAIQLPLPGSTEMGKSRTTRSTASIPSRFRNLAK